MVVLGCLAPFQSAKAGILTEYNQIKVVNVGMIWEKGVHRHKHSEGYFVGDHVGLLWDGLIVFKHCYDI